MGEDDDLETTDHRTAQCGLWTLCCGTVAVFKWFMHCDSLWKNPLLKWGSEGSVSTNTTQCVPDVLLTHTMTDGLNNWWNKWLLCWFFIVLGFEKIKQCSSSPLPSLWDLVMMAIESWSERLPHLLIYVLMSSWHFGRVKNEPLLRLPWTNTVLHMRRPIQCWRPLVVIEE